MNGTVNGTVNVYNFAGKIAMQARSGDRVQIGGDTITRLERNGVMKLDGFYTISSLFVTLDVVEPPIDPEPSDEWPPYVTLTDPEGNSQIYDKRN